MTNDHAQESFWVRCRDLTPRDRRNQLWILAALVGWSVAFTAASQLIKRDLLPAGPLAWAVATLPPIFGVLVLLAYSRYLRQADELQRLIHLQTLAFGFGGTFFAIGCYTVFERLGAPPAEPSDITFWMAILYSVGILVATWRYR